VPKDKQAQSEKIKVTDRRIFTPEGDIREEFRDEVTPVEPNLRPSPAPAPSSAPASEAKATTLRPSAEPAVGPPQGDRRKKMADKAANPGTAFTNFIEPLIAQAYMSLGMLRNPYQPQTAVDPAAARQMIDIISLLEQKTKGNLTQEESDFLATHLGDLKLAYVQRTKAI
jgi:Domain of unknown function (DUF1844)